MSGIIALAVYLAVIILWVTVIRRSVGEAMILGFLAVLPFLGSGFLTGGRDALWDAMTDEIVFATMLFVFMGHLLERVGVMDRLIDLLNSLLGGIKGGPAFVSTVAAGALGSVVHNQAAIAATVGSVTIPWMTRSKLKPTMAATVVAGNAGMGITFPFSASMFVLVGSSAAGKLVTTEALIVPLIVGGLWALLHRLIVTAVVVRRSDMAPMAACDRTPLTQSWRHGRATLFLFVAVAIPLVMTTGPLATAITDWTGEDVGDTLSIIFWIPVALIAAGLLVGWRRLPRTGAAGNELLSSSAPRFGIVGITVLFAFAGANALASTGLPEQMTAQLTGMNLPLWALAILVGAIVIAVSAPLSATATMAAVGAIGVAVLVAAGVPPTTAAVAVLVFSSCEAAVPPGGAPLYVASGIAGINPLHTFKHMLLFYALPLMAMGVLMILGVIPLPRS